MNKNKQPRYAQCYLNLTRLFDPAEMIFIMNMHQMEYLRQIQPERKWSKAFLMKKMNLGEKVFDRCVRRLQKMELLIVSPDYHPDYRWDTALYLRLVKILSATKDSDAIDEFCRRVFLEQGRSIASISDQEIEILGKNRYHPPKEA